MRNRSMNKEFNCPVEATISLIGGKYKSVILFHLMGKTLRNRELHKMDLTKEPSIRLSRPKQSTT